MAKQQLRANDSRLELDGKYSWLVSVCCLINFIITFGLLKSTGIIYVRLYETFEMTRSEAVNITIVMFGSDFTASVLCSSILKLIGFRRTLFIGITSAFLGLFFSYFVRTPGLMSLTLGVLVGIGTGTFNVALISVLSRFFKVHLGKATGIAMAGSGVGGFIFPPLVEYIDEVYGLSGTFLLLSGIVLNLFVFTSVIIEPPKRPTSPVSKDEADATCRVEGNINQAIVIDEKPSPDHRFSNGYTENELNLQGNGQVNKAAELDDVPMTNGNIGDQSASKDPKAGSTRAPKETTPICCSKLPVPKKSIKSVLKEDFAIVSNKYCLAIGLAYIPSKLSLTLSSITFPAIAVGLGFSLKQGAMLISIAASMDIISRVVNGFVLDTRALSLGFTFGFPLLFLGMCIVSMGILETSATYVSMVVISAAYGFFYGMVLLHYSIAANHYLGTRNVPIVMSFASFMVILPTFVSSPLIDLFLRKFGRYANILYINGIFYVLSSVFWIVIGVMETRKKCGSAKSSHKAINAA